MTQPSIPEPISVPPERDPQSDPMVSGDELAQEVGRALLRRGWTVGLAESCTGGLASKLLTDVPGSSRYMKGGVVAYGNSAKIELLGVERASLGAYGAVSEEVAAEMAAGAVQAFGADAGLAITGIAGPSGDSVDKPVGTVWFALATPSETVRKMVRFSGDRAAVRESAAGFGLQLILGVAAHGE